MTTLSRMPRRTRRRVAARLEGERGASAVEFALVAPVLLLLLFGIVETSQVFSTQSTLSAAAREGARVMALTNNQGQAIAAVRGASDSDALTAAQISVTPSSCVGASPTARVTVTVRFHQPFVSGFLGGAGVNLTGTAAMRCGG